MSNVQGPFTVRRGMAHAAVIEGPDHREIAYMIGENNEHLEEILALARKFASAPELLRELETLILKWEKDNPGWEATNARAAVKKAKGEL